MAAHVWFQLTTHFIDPERMKGWVGLVGWPVVDGLPTLVVTHQLQIVSRANIMGRRDGSSIFDLAHNIRSVCFTISEVSAWWLTCVLQVSRHDAVLHTAGHGSGDQHTLCTAQSGKIILTSFSMPCIDSYTCLFTVLDRCSKLTEVAR